MKMRLRERVRLETATRRCAGAAAAGVMLLLSACGGGNGGSGPTAINSSTGSPTSSVSAAYNAFNLISDSYGIEDGTYLAATSSSLGLVLRVAVASSMTDPDFRTVARIDTADPAAVGAGTTYALGNAAGAGGAAAFPGTLFFFNGHSSTLLQTVGGTIAFTSFDRTPGGTIAGSFSALVADDGDSATPKPVYSIAGTFRFTTDGSGPITPATSPVPAGAAALYTSHCADCHSLGELDSSPGTGPELSLKGGRLNTLYAAGSVGHQGVTLTGDDLSALKILLNVN